MRKIILLFLVCIIVSCQKEDTPRLPSKETDQTVFLYMPWSTNLTSYFYVNIEDMEKAIVSKASENERVVCFFATSEDEATLFELRYFDGTLRRTELKEYDVSCFPTAEGISALIGDVKHYAPASRYAMIVSCHGMGWLPITSSKSRMMDNQKDYWEYEGVPLTRYFGGLSAEYQTEIPTFAKGIKMSGTYMEYILFDDCYMSNIEVAYDLKDVADYLIASPTEVMAFGFPYAELGEYLLGDIDYRTIVDEFYNFYSSYQYPYGTIGVTDLSQVEQMARVMREINTNYDDTNVNVNSVQRMDGYSPVIFFDFGAYINSLCGGSQLASDFYTQLNHLTPFAAHTKSFYSMSRGAIYVDEYSGITISDISINSKAVSKTETAWYKATH